MVDVAFYLNQFKYTSDHTSRFLVLIIALTQDRAAANCSKQRRDVEKFSVNKFKLSVNMQQPMGDNHSFLLFPFIFKSLFH